jgi:class 3 adenylate cyclase
MTYRLKFLWLISLSMVLAACGTTSMSMEAKQGELDLSGYDFDQQRLVSLDGAWLLYWNRLLDPFVLAPEGLPPAQPDGAYTLPSSWSNIQLNGQSLSRDGYLTMRLIVRLPPGKRLWGLFVPSFNTAYQVWVNRELVATSGQVATTADEAGSAGFGQTVKFEADGYADIVVLASSFEGVPGGPIARFQLGPALAVTTWDYQQVAIDLFVTSTCFFISIYYLILYLLRRKERAFIWFSIFSLVISFRTMLVGREVIHLLLSQATWGVSIRLIFFTGQVAAVAFVGFVSALYPQEGWRKISWAMIAGSLFALSILFTPPAILFGPLNILYNALVALPILYCAVVGVRALSRKRPNALLLILSSIPLMLAIAIEALGSLRLIPLYSLAGLGVLGTIAAQTFTLLRSFTLAFAAVEALSERLDRTSRAYYRFVPRELLRLIGKEDITQVELGDQSQQAMTILFSDVRDFTSLSESMSPEENFQFINQYLGRVSPIIREHNGFIDKYLGDGIMALFPGKPEDAVQAAIVMCQSLADLNRERERRGEASIQIGIGLHLGNLMLGTVGEPERMDGTVIADAVNTAARLESLSKRYRATVIVSAQTLKAMDDWKAFRVRTLGKIRVKGKMETTTIYEVFDGDPEPVANGKRATLDQFEVALNLYQAGKFNDAAEQFRRVAQVNPADLVAVTYAERSSLIATAGVPTDWDGVETLTEK